MSSTAISRPPGTPGMSGAVPPRLQLVGITKRYPAVVAISGVALTSPPGEYRAVRGGSLLLGTAWA